MTKCLVTGGAGFIGSHLVDALLGRGDDVVVLDNLASGSPENIHPQATFVKGDIADSAALDQAMQEVTSVWHLAANPDVRTGAQEPESHFQQNVTNTWLVLEAMRRHGAKNIRFTSTSTVYGNAAVVPTPESYGPLLPISIYGGAKLACEGLICSAAATFGYDAQMFRFANVVGPRSNHGVIFDFVAKLRATPDRLEILGDGSQCKSYVHVADTVAAMLHADAHAAPGVHAFNVSSDDSVPVSQLAGLVAGEMGLTPEYVYSGGTSDGAGWTGDVKHMGLDCTALTNLGWAPTRNSAKAICDTARALL